MKTKFTLQEADKLAELGFTVMKSLTRTETLTRRDKSDSMGPIKITFEIVIRNGQFNLIVKFYSENSDVPFTQTFSQSSFFMLLITLGSYNII